MKKSFLVLIFSAFIIHFSFAQPSKVPSRIRKGVWKGTLTLNDTTELPFTFTVDLGPLFYSMIIHNASENITVENLVVTKDSINWHMPVFDSWFKCKIDSVGGFHGTFFNHSASKPYQLKFKAEYGKPRFKYVLCRAADPDISGIKWECDFSPGTADSSKAIGVFSRNIKAGNYYGTFLTETGDYRFLEGGLTSCGELTLSCFDGSHAFLFQADFYHNPVKGAAWYGKYGYEKWTAKQNEKFELRDPSKLTFVKDSSNVNFTFNDLKGNPVSLSDPKFKGKVVIIQITGSWCPNCMDETAWMTNVYNKYQSQGLEVIALAYERSPDTAKANPSIRRVRDHFNAKYTFLNTGKSGKNAASESLPFLNGIMSFPTTIYIDKTGKVRMVYTGFNGPATGAAYEKDTAEALRLIQQLLAE
ncbi:MAG: TlpA family protein disulfide reductase [Bacteroidota bacterium]|nr:TlpA family protein disulfide reductase [Bacteroidota bacterium]